MGVLCGKLSRSSFSTVVITNCSVCLVLQFLVQGVEIVSLVEKILSAHLCHAAITNAIVWKATPLPKTPVKMKMNF